MCGLYLSSGTRLPRHPPIQPLPIQFCIGALEHFVVWCTFMETSMTQLRTSGLPAYKRIQDAILKRLDAGELKPGDSVDSERELARIHGVSLMTARHALAGLEREGVVERRRGSGTFVAPPKIHFNRLMSYTEHMSSRGLSPRSRVLSAKIIEHQAEIAARLALPSTSDLVKIDRLRLTGEEPFALETVYLPAPEFAALASAPLGKSSLFA